MCVRVLLGRDVAGHHHPVVFVERHAMFPEGVHPYNKVSEAPVHTQLRPRTSRRPPLHTTPALQARAGAAGGVCALPAAADEAEGHWPRSLLHAEAQGVRCGRWDESVRRPCQGEPLWGVC